MNSDDVEMTTDAMSCGMRNLQLPVFTRWHTMIPAIKAFIKNYAVIYFFAVTIKQQTQKKGGELRVTRSGVV